MKNQCLSILAVLILALFAGVAFAAPVSTGAFQLTVDARAAQRLHILEGNLASWRKEMAQYRQLVADKRPGRLQQAEILSMRLGNQLEDAFGERRDIVSVLNSVKHPLVRPDPDLSRRLDAVEMQLEGIQREASGLNRQLSNLRVASFTRADE